MLVSRTEWVNVDLLFNKTFDYRIRNHHCIGYTDYVVETNI